MHHLHNRTVFSWALYDWANSAFATAVLAGFFPIFFKSWWSADLPATESTFQLGLANSLASTVIVILAPMLGAIADVGGLRKRFLLLFAALGITMTAGLYFVGQGESQLALVCFVLASIGFSGSVVFYDALIVSVTEESHYDIASAWGYALGYLGGGLLFAGTVAMTLWPEVFGLESAAEAVRVSFLCVAAWWLIFSLPLIFWVPEPPGGGPVRIGAAVRGGFRQLAGTFRKVRRLRVVGLFLLAYWLYIDGVDTVVRMAVDYGMALGFDSNNLITALLVTQFVGFPAAIAFGLLGNRIGPRPAILIAIAVYIGVIVWAYFMQHVGEFYALAVVIGLVQGGVQALSRSLYARLIPPDQSAEFFGFYNMLGKFAAILGPLLMGSVGLLTGSPRISILSVAILFVAGGLLLMKVDVERGCQMARQPG
ncbi:MAG TPA: MFS transporter [Gammaproteobacteria bacterium]|nr:MFS transporter [Gammaproteobacteria bacterium]